MLKLVYQIVGFIDRRFRVVLGGIRVFILSRDMSKTNDDYGRIHLPKDIRMNASLQRLVVSKPLLGKGIYASNRLIRW